MDLMELYHLRGIALVRSKLSRSAAARRGYCRLARRYADRIDAMRVPPTRDLPEMIPAL